MGTKGDQTERDSRKRQCGRWIEGDRERASAHSNGETQATGEERAWQEPRRGGGQDPDDSIQPDRGQLATDCGEKQVRGLTSPSDLRFPDWEPSPESCLGRFCGRAGRDQDVWRNPPPTHTPYPAHRLSHALQGQGAQEGQASSWEG